MDGRPPGNTGCCRLLDFPSGSDSKESACTAGDLGSISETGRPPGGGNGNPLQYSCLENPTDRAAWWARAYGVEKSGARMSDEHFHFLSKIIDPNPWCLSHRPEDRTSSPRGLLPDLDPNGSCSAEFPKDFGLVAPLSTFWNENFYNYYSVPAPPFVFWELIIYFLVSQVQRRRAIFPQDGSLPLSYRYLI